MVSGFAGMDVFRITQGDSGTCMCILQCINVARNEIRNAAVEILVSVLKELNIYQYEYILRFSPLWKDPLGLGLSSQL